MGFGNEYAVGIGGWRVHYDSCEVDYRHHGAARSGGETGADRQAQHQDGHTDPDNDDS